MIVKGFLRREITILFRRKRTLIPTPMAKSATTNDNIPGKSRPWLRLGWVRGLDGASFVSYGGPESSRPPNLPHTSDLLVKLREWLEDRNFVLIGNTNHNLGEFPMKIFCECAFKQGVPRFLVTDELSDTGEIATRTECFPALE